MRVLIAAPRRARNSLGRAFCLWLLARELGWQPVTVTPAGGPVWSPLAESEFGRSCRTWDEPLGDFDLVVAVKMLHGSLNLARAFSLRTGTPLLLDIDEPDWEARYGFTRAQRTRVMAAMLWHGRSPMPYVVIRQHAKRAVRTVSNPALLSNWPGIVVPHVRQPRPLVHPQRRSGSIRVAFVGTPRDHKGLDALRLAVSKVSGASLLVTAPKPPDARPHEEWVGSTTLAEGAALLDRSDVAVVLSEDTPFARAQLPVKVVDAMMAGRPVIASDLPPLRWAVGDAGVLVSPGSGDELTQALTRLAHDESVVELGERARARALAQFTPAAVAPALAEAARAAARARPRRHREAAAS